MVSASTSAPPVVASTTDSVPGTSLMSDGREVTEGPHPLLISPHSTPLISATDVTQKQLSPSSNEIPVAVNHSSSAVSLKTDAIPIEGVASTSPPIPLSADIVDADLTAPPASMSNTSTDALDQVPNTNAYETIVPGAQDETPTNLSTISSPSLTATTAIVPVVMDTSVSSLIKPFSPSLMPSTDNDLSPSNATHNATPSAASNQPPAIDSPTASAPSIITQTASPVITDPIAPEVSNTTITPLLDGVATPTITNPVAPPTVIIPTLTPVTESTSAQETLPEMTPSLPSEIEPSVASTSDATIASVSLETAPLINETLTSPIDTPSVTSPHSANPAIPPPSLVLSDTTASVVDTDMPSMTNTEPCIDVETSSVIESDIATSEASPTSDSKTKKTVDKKQQPKKKVSKDTKITRKTVVAPTRKRAIDVASDRRRGPPMFVRGPLDNKRARTAVFSPPIPRGSLDALIILLGSAQMQYAKVVLNRIRSAGYACDFRFLDRQPLAAALERACDDGVRFGIIVGKDNENRRTVSYRVICKTDATRTSLVVSLEKALNLMREFDRQSFRPRRKSLRDFSPNSVCKFFANGHCRFGDTCSFLHDDPKRSTMRPSSTYDSRSRPRSFSSNREPPMNSRPRSPSHRSHGTREPMRNHRDFGRHHPSLAPHTPVQMYDGPYDTRGGGNRPSRDYRESMYSAPSVARYEPGPLRAETARYGDAPHMRGSYYADPSPSSRHRSAPYHTSERSAERSVSGASRVSDQTISKLLSYFDTPVVDERYGRNERYRGGGGGGVSERYPDAQRMSMPPPQQRSYSAHPASSQYEQHQSSTDWGSSSASYAASGLKSNSYSVPHSGSGGSNNSGANVYSNNSNSNSISSQSRDSLQQHYGTSSRSNYDQQQQLPRRRY